MTVIFKGKVAFMLNYAQNHKYICYSRGVPPLILNPGTRGTKVDYQLRVWATSPRVN